jgi:hypothetical protein
MLEREEPGAMAIGIAADRRDRFVHEVFLLTLGAGSLLRGGFIAI